MAAALDVLRTNGFRRVALWVLEGNERARRFYQAGGWTSDGAQKLDESFGIPIIEVRYHRPLS
jgi:GNAT superfamily N-acetyltransferase